MYSRMITSIHPAIDTPYEQGVEPSHEDYACWLRVADYLVYRWFGTNDPDIREAYILWVGRSPHLRGVSN